MAEQVRIYQHRDSEGNAVANRTPERAVYDENGKTLDVKLKGLGIDKIETAQNEALTLIEEAKDSAVKEVQTLLPTLEKKIIGDKTVVSNGFDYSFVQLGSFATYSELKTTLDTLHSTNNSAQVIGNFRATLNGNLLFITNYVRSWSSEEFIQYIEGTVKLSEDGSLAVTTDVGRFMRKYTGGAWTAWKTADRYDEISDVDETYSLPVLTDGSMTLGTYAVNKKSFYIKVEADETAFSAGTIPARLYTGETFSTTNIPFNEFYQINGSNPITEIALYYLPATITKATSIRVIIYKTNVLVETLNTLEIAIEALNKKDADIEGSLADTVTALLQSILATEAGLRAEFEQADATLKSELEAKIAETDEDITARLANVEKELDDKIEGLKASTVVLTQEEYDALPEKKENTLYYILEE